ncbi:MAG: hypothetical protein UR25_C0001G0168 [Candidatus Nomurabacteria bacterium GW2011_GWE1_32_28]|uniref:Endonuclease/exonuclease/phosphatase domain-containing protein n=1 Tax=Candidatus Nomurabacteria bacterium GW2011_GWF1_31_48 TaxID=1618767 RepID=A0A0G0AVB1_9BACT|nr:MAG: hypothetical protein UR10_C0002G0111 [Candidatus Nomurabacteria bacterium GW2011_GWF2_30_133]KKP29000.1 MAG: hypothetical protein UR18_C0001G0121 [Candidatus Nomurabacteria bacterium GW2011_GWE2_31_40]KKP30590.1 MAG: hypothetical protein UR19_C0002G0111 [Candidatus Nomurabacteria bacterium GW2011_GWF1_31_48]KKP35255.1 MAG: hypothetical protein UR25_C0001G0168 [Candidatus Nomurabacteria bacterium GW2011_GWE1_32_28]HAS80562.1 hypothetical protein [Candidatus Nomurabacteria bacterium]
MKLITLNTWGGIVNEPLFEFIKNNSDIDIFCFQEVYPASVSPRPSLGKVRPNLFYDIQNVLPDFNGHHAVAQENDVGGLAIFIKKSFVVNNIKHAVVFKQLNNTEDEDREDYFSMGRDLQCVEFSHLGKIYSILNFHGMWVGKGKIDTKRRIEQSEKVIKIFNGAKGAKILCGDFNLRPDTKSIDILSEGNRNLVREYEITSTRSSFYLKPEKFADYIIVSPDIEVENFKVLQDQVSDHLPLLLEFK